MITVNFTEQEVQKLLEFMLRATMNGKEAFAFAAIVKKVVDAVNARNQPAEAE